MLWFFMYYSKLIKTANLKSIFITYHPSLKGLTKTAANCWMVEYIFKAVMTRFANHYRYRNK